jgi:hypothetical protein
VTFVLKDERGNEILRQQVPLDELRFPFSVPD